MDKTDFLACMKPIFDVRQLASSMTEHQLQHARLHLGYAMVAVELELERTLTTDQPRSEATERRGE